MPFIGLLTLSLVMIVIGILHILNMVNKEKKALILIYAFTAPFILILGYFIMLVIVGPIVIDALGVLNTKLIAFFLSALILMGYGKYIFTNNVSQKVSQKISGKNRKIRDIILTCVCFALAPFGFKGLLMYRGGTLTPGFGGSLCLLFGVYFLYQATKNK
ncbi:MAG: hypothetical protein V6Z89_06975 [Desulfobacter sp.]